MLSGWFSGANGALARDFIRGLTVRGWVALIHEMGQLEACVEQKPFPWSPSESLTLTPSALEMVVVMCISTSQSVSAG